MNKMVEDILKSTSNIEEKNNELDLLQNALNHDIKIAKEILEGKYKYCEECGDYYLSKSFIHENETKEELVCTYRDMINSGSNEYENRYVDYSYEVCPKGHKKIIMKLQRGKKA